jgi:hypothetical protein
MHGGSCNECDADRKVYLDLLHEDIESCKVSLIGYCLMFQSCSSGSGADGSKLC